MKLERNAVVEPQTEAAATAAKNSSARDERAWSVAEWVWSRGDRGDRQRVKPERKTRWSRRFALKVGLAHAFPWLASGSAKR
jgi:hypothetical protein